MKHLDRTSDASLFETFLEGTGDTSSACWLQTLAAFGVSWNNMEHPAVVRINATIRRIFVATNCEAISELCEFRRIMFGVTQSQQKEACRVGGWGLMKTHPHLQERTEGR